MGIKKHKDKNKDIEAYKDGVKAGQQIMFNKISKYCYTYEQGIQIPFCILEKLYLEISNDSI